MEIKRDAYLEQLKIRKDNGMIKIITGIRRCGKSFLLFVLFKKYLLESGVDNDHIIEIALDGIENEELRDPKKCYQHIKDAMKDDQKYYLLLDEVQFMSRFEEVLNSLLRISNIDVYVTGSNSKFLSSDIVTEFRGRGDEIRIYPLSFAEFYAAFDGDYDDAWEAFLISKADRYDIKGRKYVGANLKYYFSDVGLRNARLNFRQQEPTHIMENIVYNELLIRGYNVDVGIVEVYAKNDEGKTTRKQFEVDFVVNQGSQRYYIQVAYDMTSEEKQKQEFNSFSNIPDSFKKIVVMVLYSKKVYELSKESENDELDGSLSYLNAKEKEFLAFLLKKRLYEFTPIEVSKMLGVTNKTIINRCAKLVNNGLLIPIIVKTRIRSYRLSDFSKTKEKKILKKIS